MLIGGLDIGTSGCKLTVYNSDGKFVCNEYREYDVSRKNGEHELYAGVIFDAVCECLRKTLKKQPDLAGIGITSFGESFVMLDENDEPLFPSMLYTDPRGADELEELKKAIPEKRLIEITGAKPHTMYSLPKIMWIKNNRPELYRECRHILLMQDYIAYMLTGEAKIDYSLAARTMAFDIRKKCWSREIFEAAGVDIDKMPEPVPTGSIAGEIKPEFSEKRIKIISGAHDQVAAAVGAGAFNVGQAVDGSGTVECLTPVFDKIPDSAELYECGYSVVPYVLDGTYVCYALSFTGGAVLKWYRDNFARREKEEGKNVYALLDERVPEKPTDILVMPHFAGAANPYMDNGSRAAFVGLTLEHTAEDIYKALMEGVAYELMMNTDVLEQNKIAPSEIYATGGGAGSEVWLQIKADVLNRPVTALEAPEAGTCGTCMLVLTALGEYESLEEAKKHFVVSKKTYYPNEENAKIYSKKYKAYKNIYKAVRPIVREAFDE